MFQSSCLKVSVSVQLLKGQCVLSAVWIQRDLQHRCGQARPPPPQHSWPQPAGGCGGAGADRRCRGQQGHHCALTAAGLNPSCSKSHQHLCSCCLIDRSSVPDVPLFQIMNHFSVPFTILKYSATSRGLQSIGQAEPETEFHITLETYR